MRLNHAGKAIFAAFSLLLATPALAQEVAADPAAEPVAEAAPAIVGDAENGRKLAYTCKGCHGLPNSKNAYPKYSVPKLGGQSAAYIGLALVAYQSGERWHPTMKGLATTLSAQDHADLAAWFQGPERAASGAKPLGKAPEAVATCAACHGEDGVGTVPENPTIAGQHADYLAQVLNDYRLGKRQNAIMGMFAKELTQDDIRALAAYFAAQPGLGMPRY